MNEFSPAKILKDVANSIPSEFHELIIVIGSLAAGFHYFRDSKEKEVRTKDNGLRALLTSENDLEQAVHTCNNGLLVDDQVRVSELKATGERFLQDVVAIFEQLLEFSRRTD